MSAPAKKIAGSGQHSHEVPAEVGRVVLMRDRNHNGTEIYRLEGGDFRFVSLDWGCRVDRADRCLLLELCHLSVDDLREPFGCDLDAPNGLALVGVSADIDLNKFAAAVILWDSADEVQS